MNSDTQETQLTRER